MKQEKADGILTFFALFGAIVGVGFASGAELYTFFAKFGVWGIFGALVSGTLFFCLYIYFFAISNKLNVLSIKDLNLSVFGKNSRFANYIFAICNFIFAVAMLAGCETIFQSICSIGFPIYSLAIGIVAFVIVSRGIDALKKVSAIIMPIMIIVFILNLILISTKTSFKIEIINFDFQSVVMAILFTFGNFLSSIGIVCASKITKKTYKKVAFLLSFLILILTIFASILIYNTSLKNEMLLLALSKSHGTTFFLGYLIIIVFALLSTLISCVFNVKECLKCQDKNDYFYSAIIVILALMISYLGFENIIKYFYIVSGCCACFYCLVVVIRTWKFVNKKW